MYLEHFFLCRRWLLSMCIINMRKKTLGYTVYVSLKLISFIQHTQYHYHKLLDWAIILDTFLPSKHSNTDAIFPIVTSLNISSYLLGKFSTLSIRRTLRLLGLVSSCQPQLRVFSCCDKSGELDNFWILAQLWFYEYLIDITWEPVQITQCFCCFQYFPWM